MQKVTLAWQKLVYKVSFDLQLLEKVHRYVCCDDPMICQLLKIIRKRSSARSCYNFIRSDYFLDKEGKPKMIEYNLESVSMSAHSEHFQEIKKLSDPVNSDKYPDNHPCQAFSDSITTLY